AVERAGMTAKMGTPESFAPSPPRSVAPSAGELGELRVLFVFAWLVVGGEETEVRLLARNLDSARYRLEVLSTYRRPNMTLQSHEQLRELGVAVDTECYGLPPEEHPAHLARRI